MNYLTMFPDYTTAPYIDEKVVTTFAVLPRQKPKRVDVTISVLEADLGAITRFLSHASYQVSIAWPDSLESITRGFYGAA